MFMVRLWQAEKQWPLSHCLRKWRLLLQVYVTPARTANCSCPILRVEHNKQTAIIWLKAQELITPNLLIIIIIQWQSSRNPVVQKPSRTLKLRNHSNKAVELLHLSMLKPNIFRINRVEVMVHWWQLLYPLWYPTHITCMFVYVFDI